MKRKNLTTAIVAGLAGVAGLSSIANANVHINPDSVGQVLLYPYYTVNENADASKALNTLISVVNTTESVKAVKVRFLEGKNSREVLDFNLYLSPYDVWTGALVPTLSTTPGFTGQATGKLITADNSCTTPAIPAGGVEFRPYAFLSDPVGDTLDRSREGHIELIEMGTVSGSSAGAATHSGGIPPGCSSLVNAWKPGGYWQVNPTIDMNPASGGLFGGATIINVSKGNAVSYNAEALESFYVVGGFNHTEPGDLFPSLNDGVNASILFDGTNVVSTNWPSAAEAVSALFMRDHLFAEYTVNSAINSETSYVITFPTKRYYVDPAISVDIAPVVPFSRVIAPGGACEPVSVVLYDREELTATGDIDFSPRPPDQAGPALCWESNVVNVNYADNISDVLYSQNAYNLTTQWSDGWMNFSFGQATSRGDSTLPLGSAADLGDTTYNGLPMMGFSVNQYVNGSITTRAEGDTLLANYMTLFKHSYSRNITSN